MLQKNVAKGFIKRIDEDLTNKLLDRQLIESVANEKKLGEVVLSTDDVKIYKVFSKNKNDKEAKDDWDVKYPYRSIVRSKKGNWERTATVASSLEIAFLTYLEKQQLNQGSGFVEFALKMLDMKEI